MEKMIKALLFSFTKIALMTEMTKANPSKIIITCMSISGPKNILIFILKINHPEDIFCHKYTTKSAIIQTVMCLQNPINMI
jgi:hypothetical protein